MTIRTLKDALDSEDLSCDDVLCCIMGLTSTDANVFSKVTKEMSVKQVMNLTKKSQPRVQISLNKLVSERFLERKQAKSTRGIKYSYVPVDRNLVKKKLLKQLKKSYSHMKKEIESL